MMTHDKQPLISIIVPVYNNENYLPECIESIRNQTYRNLEIILVNDGSTDGSAEICDSYKQKDSRIIVFHKTNGGVSSARNMGLEKATGEYIGFIDSDDYIDEEMYEKMLKNIVTHNSQICMCTKYIVNNQHFNNCNIMNTVITREEAIRNLLTVNIPTSLWSCLYHNFILRKERLDENIHYWEDCEYQFRVVLNADRISFCHNAYYHYRQNDKGANSTISKKTLSCFQIAPKINNLCFNLKIQQKRVNYLYSYFIFSVISLYAFTLKGETPNDTEVIPLIRAEIKKRKSAVLKSNYPLTKKTIIFLFYINNRFLLNLYKIYKFVQIIFS